MSSTQFSDADALFKRLNVELAENVEDAYFYDPRDFRSLIEVLKVLGEKADQIDLEDGGDLLESLKHQNPAYSKVLNQQKLVEKVIEDVVTFQHGGLNNSVDTMTAVVREYSRGQEDITSLRQALVETKTVLTTKKSGQLAMRDLWLKKKELDESLRILQDLEWLKDSPLRVSRLVQQKRYFNAVGRLNKALERMFSEDLIDVTGITGIREQLLELKGTILEEIVSELRNDVVGVNSSALLSKEMGDVESDSDSIDAGSDNRSEKMSLPNDSKSIFSTGTKVDSNFLSLNSSNQSGTVNSSHEDLTIGLLAVDDNMELNLIDITSSGSVYIRLLVRAVGLLRCEDDVERLLLESASEEFLKVLQRYRVWAFTKLRSKVNEHANRSNDAIELDILVSDLFAGYITALLEAAVSMLRKLLYVLRLLSFSKYLGSAGITSTSSSQVQTKGIASWTYVIQEPNRKAILSLWSEVEEILISELKIHFVEKDVEKISDFKTSQASSTLPSAGGKNSSILPSQSGTAGQVGYEEDDGDGGDDTGPIFPPSVKLASSVYRNILSFVDVIQDVFRDEGFNKTVAKTESTGKPLTIMATLQANKKDTPIASVLLDSIQVILERELIPVIQGSVNQSMRDIQLSSRQYFAPVSTRHVVGSNDALGGSSDTISPSKKSPGAIGSNTRVRISEAKPCMAAQVCLREARPLFNYWLQLPQHSDMVVTILDRLVRGFVSSAKEEIEAMSWQLLSGQDIYRRNLVLAMRNGTDNWFQIYRRTLYGGKMSAEEILANFGRGSSAVSELIATTLKSLQATQSHSQTLSNKNNNTSTTTSSSSSSSSTNPSTSTIDNPYDPNSEWAPLWDVSNAKYVVSIDKIVRDFTTLGSIASIAFSCDWLVANLSKACGNALKRLNALSVQQQSIGNASDILRVNQSADRLAKYRQEIAQMQEPLLTGFLGYTKELSKLSEECWAQLQLEAQLSCFYYLHQLAHMKILTSSGVTNSLSSNEDLIRHSTAQSVNSASSVGSSNSSGLNQSTSASISASTSASTAESNIIVLLSQHLLKLTDAIMSASSTKGVTICIAPLTILIPRILQRCITILFLNNSSANIYYTNTANSSSSDSLQASQSVQLDSKTRLLKLVVIAQQSLSMVLEATHLEGSAFKIIHELANDSFEHVRKYVSLMDLSMSELKNFISNQYNLQQQKISQQSQSQTQQAVQYDKEDFKAIWKYVQQRTNATSSSISTSNLQSFEEYWKSLSLIGTIGSNNLSSMDSSHERQPRESIPYFPNSINMTRTTPTIQNAIHSTITSRQAPSYTASNSNTNSSVNSNITVSSSYEPFQSLPPPPPSSSSIPISNTMSRTSTTNTNASSISSLSSNSTNNSTFTSTPITSAAATTITTTTATAATTASTKPILPFLSTSNFTSSITPSFTSTISKSVPSNSSTTTNTNTSNTNTVHPSFSTNPPNPWSVASPTSNSMTSPTNSMGSNPISSLPKSNSNPNFSVPGVPSFLSSITSTNTNIRSSISGDMSVSGSVSSGSSDAGSVASSRRVTPTSKPVNPFTNSKDLFGNKKL